jgi:N-glycosylase/DNA lyase
MNYQTFNGNIAVSGIDCLNLDLTLDCGQAFRWEKQNDGSWSGVAGGNFLNIYNDGDKIIFKNTSIDVFENFWIKYFDLNKDYNQICQTLKGDELISSAIEQYYGIRILNQNSWEALCSFVISQQNNIKRIKQIVKRLSEAYGNDLGGGFYTFPTPESLAQHSQQEFESLGLGYRAEYIEKLAKGVASGQINIDYIKSLPTNEARKELLKIKGVGIKVANCALLYGMEKYECVPVDTWMNKALKYYPNGLPKCFAGYEGIAQQYLFHWARNNLK